MGCKTLLFPGKTLIFIGAVHCHACTWQNGELSAEECFADNAEGKEQFTAFLKTHRAPALLLTDLVEEDFRHETVPHLRGSDRTELIQRKLEQYYRDTPFRQAITLQRHKEGRRDDDMLFSALTNPALITPWLDIMLAHNIALAGIYSIPNISAPLVKDISSGSLLLLSWEKHAGLRQTYFDAKLLSFSRLTPINDSGSFCATAGTEAVRIQQYLNNLSLLPPGQALNVTIICHAADRHELEAHLSDDSDIHYAYLDIQELGRHIGSKTIYPDSNATPLFMHLLAAHPPRSHYAAAAHTHFLRLLQLRQSLLGLSAVFLTASLLWAAADIRAAIVLEGGKLALKAQGLQLSQQTRQIIQNFPNGHGKYAVLDSEKLLAGHPDETHHARPPLSSSLPQESERDKDSLREFNVTSLASATNMKTAVILSRKLDNTSPPPQIILDGISHTLDDFPAIRIDKLSWQTGSAAPLVPGASGAASAAAPPENAASIAPAQVILLSGELAEFTGGYRTALDYLERFRQALIQRGYSVTALTLPLDISPQGSIATDTGDGSNRPAQFALKIFWRAAT